MVSIALFFVLCAQGIHIEVRDMDGSCTEHDLSFSTELTQYINEQHTETKVTDSSIFKKIISELIGLNILTSECGDLTGRGIVNNVRLPDILNEAKTNSKNLADYAVPFGLGTS